MLQSELHENRVARKKQMPEEVVHDERLSCPKDHYRVEVFRRSMDQINRSLTESLSDNIGFISEVILLTLTIFTI